MSLVASWFPGWLCQWRFLHAKSGGPRRGQQKSGRARLKKYLRNIFWLSIIVVYISFQEWQNTHKTMFTTILLSYSAVLRCCFKAAFHDTDTDILARNRACPCRCRGMRRLPKNWLLRVRSVCQRIMRNRNEAWSETWCLCRGSNISMWRLPEFDTYKDRLVTSDLLSLHFFFTLCIGKLNIFAEFAIIMICISLNCLFVCDDFLRLFVT